MSVLEAFFAPNLQNPKTALASPLVSATFYSSYIRLKDPVLPTMQKKGALRLVQSVLNSFIIRRILRKSRRKNEQFEGKIDHFRSFFSLFQPFSGTWSLRRIIALTGTVSVSSLPAFSRPLLPTLPWSLGPCRGPQRQVHVAGAAWVLGLRFLRSLFPFPCSRFSWFGKYA
jgi:hypothetical protein